MSEQRSRDLTRFNLIASVTLSLFGLLALVYLIPFHIPAPKGIDQGLSARFMPTVAATTLTILAVLLGGNIAVRLLRGHTPPAEDNEDNEIQGFGWRESVNAMILLAGSAAYVALLKTVGFVAASAIALAVCFYFGHVRHWAVLVLIGIGLPLALSQILWHALSIIMPPFSF